MGKYEPFGKFLKSQKFDRIAMTFSEIERVLKSKLPESKRHRAWWSNNPDNNVMTREWLAAGYETEAVDIEAEKLVFRRATPKKADRPGSRSIFGCLKGMVTIREGFDLTAPMGADWGEGRIGGIHGQ
jgi:hypothetical protein